jgi:hypothetical protein
LDFRLADFAAFGWVLFATLEDDRWISPEWELRLKKLRLAQHHFTASGNSIIDALHCVLQHGPVVKMSTSILFENCRLVADREHMQLPKTVNRFGQELTNLKGAIETELDVVFTEEHDGAGKRFISLIPKRADTYFQNGSSRAANWSERNLIQNTKY